MPAHTCTRTLQMSVLVDDIPLVHRRKFDRQSSAANEASASLARASVAATRNQTRSTHRLSLLINGDTSYRPGAREYGYPGHQACENTEASLAHLSPICHPVSLVAPDSHTSSPPV